MFDTFRQGFSAISAAILLLLCALSAKAQSVALAWAPSSSPDIVGYMLYYGTDDTNFNSMVDAGNNELSLVTNLQAGVTYYFEVVAYDTDGNESPPSEYVTYTVPNPTPTLTVISSATNAGSVTGAGNFPLNSSATVTATANSGYTFANWRVNGIVQSASSSYTFVILSNCDLVADFTTNPVTYTVAASSDSNGSISHGTTQTIAAGGNATFTATPDTGFYVNQWLVNGASVQTGGLTYTLSDIATNDIVTVSFSAAPTVMVAVSASAGSVTGGGIYAANASVTVTATPNTGYTFADWTSNGIVESTSSSYTFTAETNCSLAANFTANPITYTVSASASGNGSISSSGTQTVGAGGSVTFSATPASGYYVSQWLVNGAVVQAGGLTFTLAGVAANETVSVAFSSDPAVTVSVDSTNAGSVTGGGIYAVNSSATVIATANSGYTFSNWTANGNVLSTSSNYTFTVVTNCSLVANFSTNLITYTVTASAGNNGNITPIGTQTVVSGSNIPFSATPFSGYYVNQWLVNGAVVQTGGAAFALTNIVTNDTVAVSFAPNLITYTVTASSVGNGTITPGGAQSVVAGDDETFSATPASGFHVDQWLLNSVVVQTNSLTFTLTNIVTNDVVEVSFATNVIPATNSTSTGVSQTAPEPAANTNFSLVIVGNGKLTPYHKGRVFNEGKKYTLTAIATTGWVFADWISNGVVVATIPKYNFVVQSNVVLEANFIPNPFLPVAGTYRGLFYNTNEITEGTSGSFVATVGNSGAFSARLLLNGSGYSVSGKFDLSGAAVKTISRPGLTPITVQLQLGWTNGVMTGTISQTPWTADLAADRAIYSNKNPAPQAGKYTLLIPAAANTPLQAAGNGIGAVAVNDSGAVTITGMLGDGTVINAASVVSGQGQWPVYISLYGGKGSILGWLTFTNDASLGGQVAWFKSADSAAKAYPQGFSIMADAIGSAYHDIKGASPLTFADGVLSLSGGNLAQSIISPTGFGEENAEASTQAAPKLTFSSATGLFHGSVTNPETGKPISFHGVVLQNQNIGAGLFVDGTDTGSVMLSQAQ